MFILLIFLIGVSVGSFINVLESRLYKDEDIFKKPSHCDFCKKILRVRDLIPVVSWLVYGGKTRCCGRRLSIQYPLVEFITGVSFVVIYAFGFSRIEAPGFSLNGLNGLAQIPFSNLTIQQFSNLFFYFVIFTLSFAIFLQDLKYQAIHEKLLQFLIAITLIFNFQFSIFNENVNFQLKNLLNQMNLLPAFLSALPFYLIYKLSKEKWLGEGDVWISFWIGLFLGFPKAFLAIYFGIICGGFVSLAVLLLHLKKLRDTISLGPFLLIGVLVSLIFNFQIL